MKIDDEKLLEILVIKNYLTVVDVVNARKYTESTHTSVIDYLLGENIINKELLGQAVAEAYEVPYVDLQKKTPAKKDLEKIPTDVARKFRVILIKQDDESVTVTTDDPDNKELKKKISEIFPDKKVIVAYSHSGDIDIVMSIYKKPLEVRFIKILAQKKQVAPDIIDEIIEDSINNHVSDIHFEPQLEETIIRFRIDGSLHEVGKIPKKYYENILNRIKVMGRLRLDEHFSTQDGAIRYQKDKLDVDLRVSIVPTVNGEKIVIRLLSKYIQTFTLQNLGLSARDQAVIETSAKKPFGMVVVVGPTGSGKTTTLYAILRILNSQEVNITTIEDPVEYKVKGINQIQVNKETDLTFAKGLRSIVRQDPDVILIGEIRDQETAEIAVHSSLTGHLVLSTLHANNAATAIPRFMEMGVEPFLLASTIELIISQRLIRKICDACKHSTSISWSDLEEIVPEAEKHFEKKDKVTMYKGKGCSVCGGLGYKGRTSIYEMIQINPAMKELLLKDPSTKEIQKLAKEQSFSTMFEDGLQKVIKGETTLEELKRVAVAPD